MRTPLRRSSCERTSTWNAPKAYMKKSDSVCRSLGSRESSTNNGFFCRGLCHWAARTGTGQGYAPSAFHPSLRRASRRPLDIEWSGDYRARQSQRLAECPWPVPLLNEYGSAVALSFTRNLSPFRSPSIPVHCYPDITHDTKNSRTVAHAHSLSETG